MATIVSRGSRADCNGKTKSDQREESRDEMPALSLDVENECQQEPTLSVADELLQANEIFARSFNLGNLSVRPRRHAAVLACMDSRILFEHCLGLRPGDAHMIAMPEG